MSAKASEPVLDRWDEESSQDFDEEPAGMEIFGLSGGVLGTTKTSNRIDGLLGKMLVNQSQGKYLGDIDKNLDYLYTSLQLDLIERVAKDVSSKTEEEEEPREDLKQHEDAITLDRVRLSY